MPEPGFPQTGQLVRIRTGLNPETFYDNHKPTEHLLKGQGMLACVKATDSTTNPTVCYLSIPDLGDNDSHYRTDLIGTSTLEPLLLPDVPEFFQDEER